MKITKKAKKFTLLGLVSITTCATISLPLALVSTEKHENFRSLAPSKEAIKSTLLNNSKLVKGQKYYKYKDNIFTSEDELNNFIFNNGQVKTYATSTNPYANKVIIDHENNIIDPNMLFDLDVNNTVQVFEDAFHNLRTSKDDALKTFINQNDIHEQYSYNGVDWFNSVNDLNHRDKQNMQTKSSIYYFYNGKYYNAFNSSDIKDLISNMKEGIYLDINKGLGGGIISKEVKPFYGESESIRNLSKKAFQDDFSQNFYNDITDFEGKSTFNITIPYGTQILIDGLFDQWTSKKTISMTLPEIVRDSVKFKNDFWNNWDYSKDGYSAEQSIEIVSDSGTIINTKIHIKSFTEVPMSDGTRMFEYVKLNKNDLLSYLSLNVNSTGEITFYKWTDKQEKINWKTNQTNINITDKSQIWNDSMMEMYDQWFDEYFNEVITNFGTHANENIDWNAYKEGTYLKNINSKINFGSVYRDKFYQINSSKGYDQSLIQSIKDWKVIKEQIISNYENKNKDKPTPGADNKVYNLRNDFREVSLSELNNFLNLEGAVDSRVMWTTSIEDNVSDQTGRFLANTEVQAKQMAELMKEDSIKTHYLICDIFGNTKFLDNIVEGHDWNETMQNILNDLRKTYALNSKYIPQKELKLLEEKHHGETINWSDIVTDGAYQVYSIPNPNSTTNNGQIWFATIESALAATKEKMKISDDLTVLYDDSYVYNYLTPNGDVLLVNYHQNEIDEYVTRIYNYEILRRGVR